MESMNRHVAAITHPRATCTRIGTSQHSLRWGFTEAAIGTRTSANDSLYRLLESGTREHEACNMNDDGRLLRCWRRERTTT